jgi:hypothetical protein
VPSADAGHREWGSVLRSASAIPYFLEAERRLSWIWRTQIKDNLSWIRGGHTIKVGGEWMHTANDQVSEGFSRPLHLRQRHRVPALRVAARSGGFRSE